MVSMKDIAAACSVSVATVSKALNDHSDIGEETKARIRQTAKDMGYHPNSSARTLKTNKSYNLGVLYKEKTGSGLTHEYFSQILEGFRREAEHQGYDITFLSNSKSRKNRMSFLDHSLYRGMDGVIIAVADYNDPEVIELLNSEIAVVCIDYVFNGRISVMSDNEEGMSTLLQHIYDKGHRRIAYIYGDDSLVTSNRISTYYQFLDRNGLEFREEYLQKGKYRDSIAANTITQMLLDLKEPPTCIVYADDFSAIGGINYLKNKGINVPQDISVAGYDGIVMASQLQPQLTTYKQDTIHIGQLAASQLISLIEKPKATIIKQYLTKGNLIEGGSVARLQA